MQPTIKDVARQAGVSTATVSRVLNDFGGVSDHAKARVSQAISDLGYRYNALAGSLKRRQSGLLGYMVPSIAASVAPILARAVEEQAQESGYSMILCNSLESPEKERANLKMLLERRVDGIIFSSPLLPESVRVARARGVPVVIIERRREIPGFHFVEGDNFQGAHEAVTCLIRLGHRRIAMIGGPHASIIAKHRMEGYGMALADGGLSLDSELVLEGSFSRISGYEAMRKLLSLKERPTAVFAADDAMAIGAMQAVRGDGLDIPKDICFVGYDDTCAELAVPPLTTVHQPFDEIGTLAAKIVVAQIEGAADYPLENVLPCRMKERESTGECGGVAC